MDAVGLRPARPEDIAQLAPIEAAANQRYQEFGYQGLPEGDIIPPEVAARAVAQGRITVATVGGEVVGWLLAARVGGELCLAQVSVLPVHGRRGVGTALLRHLIAQARSTGEPSIVLNAQSDIPWAGPWYARHGFRVIPPEEWTEALHKVTLDQKQAGLDWSTRVHMRLRLDPTPPPREPQASESEEPR
jgi:4-diphosphocytidyl-2-C-methyl-D-erythritol kinase